MKAQDARVVITGAAGGIGSASARALLDAGASVMLVGRSSSKLDDLAARLRYETGGDPLRVDACAADITRDDDLAMLAARVAGWGSNVLVHNAGLPSFGRLQDMPLADVQAVMRTNLLAPMLLTQVMLPHLLSLPTAQVICVGSALGAIGMPGYSVYSAGKFGLRGFAQALRRELGETSVRVQYLGPRGTKTGFNSDAAQAYAQQTGSRADSPERVAQALLTLLQSDAAERFVGFPEKLAVRINGLAPSLLDGSFKRHSQLLSAMAIPGQS